MSLLKRIFGGKGFEGHRADADRLFEAREFGQAKLAYERAIDRAKGQPETVRQEIETRIGECCDAIARARIEEAKRHLDQGEPDLAAGELEGAADTAADPALVAEAQRLRDEMERADARKLVDGPEEVGEEDRLAAVAGSWEAAQDDEYAALGDEMTEALLALYGDRVAEAKEKLEAILEKALEGDEAPRYLWLEVGRARLLNEEWESGEEAIRAFLDSLEEDEGGEARLVAHMELAGLAEQRDDEEGALAELQAAVEALPEDVRPLHSLGAYLRRKGHAEEAVEVLEAAAEVMGDIRPDVRVLQELGLAHADAGEREKARNILESVVRMLTSRRQYDLPPATAVTLATIYEEEGRRERAADMYRTLTRGSDRANHLTYHREAARLLEEIELYDEARRMLQRAAAIAGDEDRAGIEEALARLEAR